MYRHRRRDWRGMLPFLGLHVASEYNRLDRKPPVTAGLLLANTLIYLRPAFLDDILPTVDEVWFNPHLIVKNRDIRRFFLSAFYHMGEPHLVYNMMSLLWKGIQLEISMGSIEFASMIVQLLAMSQGITLLLAKGLLLFDYDRPYYREYSVGFSGVLFAMKVVLNSHSFVGYTNVHGVVVPTHLAVWAELIIIQLFVPDVSFLGHLGGILAGILYLQLKKSYMGEDPVTAILRSFIGIAKWPFRFLGRVFRLHGSRISGRGRVGGVGRGSFLSANWRCSVCTYDNSAWRDACEMCESRRNDSDSSIYATEELSLEELRLRRIQRFGW